MNKTFCTVTINRNGEQLQGYMMDDGTFQFIIGGIMQSFITLLDVWSAWAEQN